ncbi:MAG: hypothetical protein ACR2PZ_14110 [Pseudomonadales bacterium]
MAKLTYARAATQAQFDPNQTASALDVWTTGQESLGRRAQAPSQSLGEQVEAQQRESAMQDHINKQFIRNRERNSNGQVKAEEDTQHRTGSRETIPMGPGPENGTANRKRDKPIVPGPQHRAGVSRVDKEFWRRKQGKCADAFDQ